MSDRPSPEPETAPETRPDWTQRPAFVKLVDDAERAANAGFARLCLRCCIGFDGAGCPRCDAAERSSPPPAPEIDHSWIGELYDRPETSEKIRAANKALSCLYIAVDESIARDVQGKCQVAIGSLVIENETLRSELSALRSSLSLAETQRDELKRSRGECWVWGEKVRSVFDQLVRDEMISPAAEDEMARALYPTRFEAEKERDDLKAMEKANG